MEQVTPRRDFCDRRPPVNLVGSISAKVMALTVFALLAVVAVGVTGWSAVSGLQGRVNQMGVVQHVLHNQAEADGGNHAIQFDVLAAATATTAKGRKAALDDLAERRAALSQRIGDSRTVLEDAGAGEQLRQAFADLAPTLAAYEATSGAAADALEGRAGTAAKVAAVDAAQAAFDVRFDQLTARINEFADTARRQAEEDTASARRRTLVLLVLAGAVVPGVGLLIRHAIDRTIRTTSQILAVVDAAAGGDLTGQVTVVGDDPIGRVGQGMARLLGQLRASIGGIGQTAAMLAAASGELLTVGQQMAATARTASDEAGVVSATAGQVSASVETVAAGAEEMGAAIGEIARNATQAAGVAASAVRVAEETNATVAKLGASSAEIGEVVKVITAIAEQTNLLALNATIEAARAGEAGKGFAVVAGEVKELARQTANATADIAARIDAIRTDTKAAVAAIGEIGKIIAAIDDTQATIAAAVEQQTTTTAEISRSVAEAATSSAGIAERVSGLARASEQTTSGVAETQRAAHQLAGMAAELRQLVGHFTC
jgi:methyl-accepting chemotaxis protein